MSNLTILILLLIIFRKTTAEIKTIRIASDERSAILLDKFGFTDSGHLSISVNMGATFTSVHELMDPSQLAFYILSFNWLTIREKPRCPLHSNAVEALFNFTQLIPPPQNSFNQSYLITSPTKYRLYFVNCQPYSRVTMNVTTEMYNNLDTGGKNYLPVGQTQLPVLYLVFAAIYFVFLGIWLRNSGGVPHVGVHWLMGGLILMKALSLICAAVDKQSVGATGVSHGWDSFFLGFQWGRVIWLYIIIIASLAICRSIMKPPVLGVLFVFLMNVSVHHSFAVILETADSFIKDGEALDFGCYYFVMYIGVLAQAFMCSRCHDIPEFERNERNVMNHSCIVFMLWCVISSFAMIFRMVLSSWFYQCEWVGNGVVEAASLLVYKVVCISAIVEQVYYDRLNKVPCWPAFFRSQTVTKLASPLEHSLKT